MNNFKIKNYWLDEITENLLKKLKNLFDNAYFNSYMHKCFLKDLKEKHNYFQLFLAYDKEKIVWVVVLEDKIHNEINYLDYPQVHLQRFTVDENYRWKWIWKKLLDKLKDYAFNYYWLSVVFWESNEISWINFYLKQKALFKKEVIENYLKRNSKSANLFFFKEFIINKKFRNFRYPEWNWLLFVFLKDKNTLKYFKDKWFYDRDYFIN